MNVLYSILSLLVFALPLQDGRKFMIMEMNSSYVIIDSKVMQEGDVFQEGAEVWWCFRGQSMEVMDINTSKMYKFSSKADYKNSASTDDFWGYKQPLSTNDDDSVTKGQEPAYFYIKYMQNGEPRSGVLSLNIDLNALPNALSLGYHDPESESDRIMTDDFRGFLKNLAEADRKAKEELSKTDYYVGEEQKLVDDYMALMKKYTDPRFKDIRYTYKELKLFLKL